MADPKYQFTNRWAEIGPLLFPDATPEQNRALSMLEQKDRDAEDHWGAAGGGGAQSIISIGELTHNHDDDSSTGASGFYTDLTFVVPADPSFNYYLDWDLNGNVRIDGDATGAYQMFAQILGQSPGAGFENYGFLTSIMDGATFGGGVAAGHGHRIEYIDPVNHGTTITLRVDWAVSASASTRIRHVDAYGAKLIAVPI